MLRKVLGYGFAGTIVAGTANLHRYEYDVSSVPLVRVLRAAGTVFDIGYCYKTLLYSKGLDSTSDEYFELRNSVHKIAAEKLLELCKTNKGVYIKVGQHIGSLDYLLPREYVETMKILHKDAPSNTVEQLYKVIREDLKQEPEELFSEFNPIPLGTASLAQVHKAKLKDGTTVAVKVQHHYVKDNTVSDVQSMELLVHFVSWAFPDFSIQWLVDETKHNIFNELDFLKEGLNSEKMATMFKEYQWLKIPKVFWEYSTRRVLVMEFVDGGYVNDLNYVKEHKIDPYDLSRKLGDLYSHMIFVNGFVHSDPHPGNILIKKDPGDKDVSVYLIDHGLYAVLSDDFRYNYSQFWLSIINTDLASMKYYARKLGVGEDMFRPLACMVSGRPWNAIAEGITKVKPGEVERDTIRTRLPEVLDQIAMCLQRIDRQALLILKTNDLIRGIEYSLKTNDMMCGFVVMTKCCHLSIHNEHFRNSTSVFKKMVVTIARAWTLFKFYIVLTYIDLRGKLQHYLLQ